MVSRKFMLFITGVVLFGVSVVRSADSRITLPGGKKVFLSGMNLAWINFANDVGDTPLDTAKVGAAMKAIADSGANCMRIWLSTNGTNDPKFGSDGLVSGPGSQTIANIQKMLKLGKKHNILVMPVFLTHGMTASSLNPVILANNLKILQTTAGLQAYIDNYVKQVVIAIGNDPNLVCWEVCNEPEGMYQQWNNKNVKITKEEIQRLVNWVASAVHQAVPKVLVSNGAAGLDFKDWYTDTVLRGISGGKADGTLDFYMIHYYGWNRAAASPFKKPCSYWNLDKPLVIGEYASSDYTNSTASSTPITDGGAGVDTSLVYLDNNSYAGGLGWQYQPDAGDPWLKGFATFGHALAEVYRRDSVSIRLTGNSGGTFVVSASATTGGTVRTSLSGRIDSLKTDTLTATASPGYTFTGWTGDTTSASPLLIIKNVVKDWALQANFTPDAGTNLVKSGDFADGSAWNFWADDIDNDATVSFAGGQAAVTILKSDTVNWKISVSQGGIKLDSGVTMVLTFDAWSSAERKLFAGLSTAVTYHFQGGGEVVLSSAKKTFTVEMTPDSSTDAGIVQFCCGASTLPVNIDNVSLAKKPTAVLKRVSAVTMEKMAFNRLGNRIYWTAPSKSAAVSLMRLDGSIVQSAITKNPVDLTNLPSGLYLFAVNSGMSRRVFKIAR